ncbi:MAG: sigma-54-dependent transcriptional regulator [Rhabdochlamydiaceae bacterium]
MKHILLQSNETLLFSEGDITIAKNNQSLLQLMKGKKFDLVIVEDLNLFDQVKQEFPQTPTAMAPLIGSIPEAVEAMRRGALDYIVKPLTTNHMDQLLERLKTPIPKKTKNMIIKRNHHEVILSESVIMQKVLADIEKIAQSSAAVFISGESGTGKEVIAHAIHYQSSRNARPFVKVNCAAIAESLIESEFFGHEKGSFTGAMEQRMGRFELAHLGTLLLDEVSEIPLGLQAKLLRVVQEQEFERVGGSKPIHVDVRLIATSNRNMKEMVDQKLFREDLFFRLNVIPIQLPPLRERKDDILALANYFLERFCEENQKRKKQFSSAAQTCLLDYPWPGNIRELANTIERAVVMHSADIFETPHLNLDPTAPALLTLPISNELTLAEIEKQHILETLSRSNHNRTRAAQVLGINVRTLRNKLSQYRLE